MRPATRHLAISLLAILLVSCSDVPGDAAYRGGHYETAKRLYEEQYKLGNASAGYRLASMLQDGIGGAPDKAKAFEIYTNLAMKGEVVACHNLGVCYEYGTGTPINYPEAAHWYKKAADAGNLWSIYNYGTLYANSYIKPSNDVEGLAYLLCAMRLAKGDAAVLEFIRNDTPGHVKRMKARMTPEQIGLAENQADGMAKRIPHPLMTQVETLGKEAGK